MSPVATPEATAALPLHFEPLAVPLTVTPQGTLRVGTTRVSLDSVIYRHREGDTPEQIVEQYPSLQIEDVYLVVSYYLRHRREVDSYLAKQERDWDRKREEHEKRFGPGPSLAELEARQKKKSS